MLANYLEDSKATFDSTKRSCFYAIVPELGSLQSLYGCVTDGKGLSEPGYGRWSEE